MLLQKDAIHLILLKIHESTSSLIIFELLLNNIIESNSYLGLWITSYQILNKLAVDLHHQSL